ncbi:hypothetical protein D3874_01090 [Oleomonas cavernae]|uniref:Uncharacterized protein n=1 Tax=Oleomonas cavernae TaxID=2320859 RepID=A0A418WT80_9PROT|nr:hypothetical protein D3874_01090 [Oleomonas cavernae]
MGAAQSDWSTMYRRAFAPPPLVARQARGDRAADQVEITGDGLGGGWCLEGWPDRTEERGLGARGSSHRPVGPLLRTNAAKIGGQWGGRGAQMRRKEGIFFGLFSCEPARLAFTMTGT